MHLHFVLIVVISITWANAKTSTNCREPVILQDFDVTRVLGSWYEYSRQRNIFEDGCDCLTSEISAVDSDEFQVQSCCQLTKVSNETQKCNIGIEKVRLTDPEKKEASFRYHRPGVAVESHLWIIDTDYENYMILDGCDNVSDEEQNEVFWILSRNERISAKQVQKIDEILRTHKVDRSKIIKQKQGVNICTSKRPRKDTLSGKQKRKPQKN
ncbi:Apolipoprotein D [Pseudolycoriella hygida]|uniref:Apolipoprotein D n=1 Tax=Pseudolycoriella hygida TaxID=35572 RepID=A0A9Q0MZF5_9DIPT|nr:Apolipoprotein D [Pseudolycoriella hygida]